MTWDQITVPGRYVRQWTVDGEVRSESGTIFKPESGRKLRYYPDGSTEEDAMHLQAFGGDFELVQEKPLYRYSTREQWLTAGAKVFEPWFNELDHSYPEVLRVSCGLAGARIGGKRIGECWSDEASKDHAREVFISPELDDPSRVLDVLLHELIHAVLPHDVGHGRPFKKLMKSLGLEGKATATIAGDDLKERLNAMIADELGPYPHAALTAGSRKKQGTRMLKIECPGCGYTVRAAAKWIHVGLPTCSCGTEMFCPDVADE